MFSYKEFVSKVKADGIARQNRFFIQISLPSLNGASADLFSSSDYNFKKLHAFCKGVTVQGVNVATVSHRDVGETFEVPYDRNFSPATFTFYMDRNMYIRKFFEDWVNFIQDPSSRQLSYYKEFVSPEVIVCILDKNDRVNYMVVLYDVFPKTIGALSLDQGANDIMTFDVTLDYHYHLSFVVPQSSSSEVGGAPDTQLYRTPNGEPAPSRINRISISNPSVTPIQRLNPMTSSQALQNTLRGTYSSLLDAVNEYRNDFLGFQRNISQGLGVLNNVGSDIRTILNTPSDILNSAKSTMRDIEFGLKNFKNSVKIL